jgi:hypothetical protein
MHYNFCRIHQTLRVTPAMEAGVSDHVWTIDEIVALLSWMSRGVSNPIWPLVTLIAGCLAGVWLVKLGAFFFPFHR